MEPLLRTERRLFRLVSSSTRVKLFQAMLNALHPTFRFLLGRRALLPDSHVHRSSSRPRVPSAYSCFLSIFLQRLTIRPIFCHSSTPPSSSGDSLPSSARTRRCRDPTWAITPRQTDIPRRSKDQLCPYTTIPVRTPFSSFLPPLHMSLLRLTSSSILSSSPVAHLLLYLSPPPYSSNITPLMTSFNSLP